MTVDYINKLHLNVALEYEKALTDATLHRHLVMTYVNDPNDTTDSPNAKLARVIKERRFGRDDLVFLIYSFVVVFVTVWNHVDDSAYHHIRGRRGCGIGDKLVNNIGLGKWR